MPTPKPTTLPPPLAPGDLLRVVVPSGCLRERSPSGGSEREALRQGVALWQQRGYRVELPSDWEAQYGYLAGTDAQRRAQLAAAWADPECKGILCARGGYGAMRLLEDWQWGNAEKWLIGFSDITALLWSLSCVGIAGIHAPMLISLPKEPDWSQQRLFNLVERHALEPLQGKGWGKGNATGCLFPGNLAVATHLLGTPWQPDLTGAILAFEDIGEAPYRVDRLLTHWRLMGAFQNIAGIALGRFSQCEASEGVPSLTVAEVLRDRLLDLNLPVVAELPFGHAGVNAALPVGTLVHLDGDRGTLTFIDGS